MIIVFAVHMCGVCVSINSRYHAVILSFARLFIYDIYTDISFNFILGSRLLGWGDMGENEK